MKSNAGISLITAIIVITVISFLGVVTAALFSTKTAATVDRLSSVRAQFIAEGGLERGILQYKADCTNYTGEANVALGGGRFTITVYTTAFDGTTALTGQKRIRSTGSIAGATKVVEQIATCPGGSPRAITSRGNITMWPSGSAAVTCGGQTCNQAAVDAGTCACAQENSTGTFPAVTVPGGLNAPGGICEYNGGTRTWNGGTYYCSSLHLNSGAVVNLTGPVTIYTSSFAMNNASRLNMNAGSLAANLLVMVTASGYCQLNSDSLFKGYIYSPGTNVTTNQSGTEIYGGVTGLSVTMNSSSGVTWDNTAGSAAPNFTTLTGGGGGGGGGGGSDTHVDWREAPP